MCLFKTHLELPQIRQTYFEIFVWLEHLIKLNLEYHEKKFIYFSLFYIERYIL